MSLLLLLGCFLLPLQAAENRYSQSSSHESSGASVGLTIGLGGSSGFELGVNVSASGADGRGVGEGLHHSDTIVSAGGQVTLQSGGDTTLQGAQIIGEQVTADIGGDLRITSLQDSSTYDEESQSWGVGISIPIGAGIPMVSVSRGETDISSDYQSVGTQSGIRAGDGGFQVNVGGSTTLEGGAITSTQTAIDNDANQFHTAGELTLTDIDNRAQYDAEGYQIGIGSRNTDGGITIGGDSAGYASESGSAYSTTQASISGIAGNTEARTGDVETGLKPIFDQDRVRRDIQDGVQATAAFGAEASQAAADYANQRADELMLQGNEAEAEKWEEGGIYRVLAHALIGAITGNLEGAAGAAGSAYLVPLVGEQLQLMGLPDDVTRGIMLAVGAGVGAAAGEHAGAAAGFNEAANNSSTAVFLNREVRGEVRREYTRLLQECATSGCTQEDYRRIDSHVMQFGSVLTAQRVMDGREMTPQQAEQLAQFFLELAPGYGTAESYLQLVTGRTSISDEEASRFWAALGIVPGAGAAGRVGEASVDAVRAWIRGGDGVADAGRGIDRADGFYDPRAWRDNYEQFYGGNVTSSTVPPYSSPNVRLAGQSHPETGIVFDSRGFPIFDDVAQYDTRLSLSDFQNASYRSQMSMATRDLRGQIAVNPQLANRFDSDQLAAIQRGDSKIPRLTWHHHQDSGRMQLVPSNTHRGTGHVGGEFVNRGG